MPQDKNSNKYDTEDELLAPRFGVLSKQERLYVDMYIRNLKKDVPVKNMVNIINQISSIYEKYPDINIWEE